MINFIATNPPVLQRFLNKFKDVFTKPTFLSFSFYVNGLFLQLKRTNIQSITANIIQANYENMQYFISEAKWDQDELNSRRIQILQSNRTTKSSHKGILSIDDTGCKKWGLSIYREIVDNFFNLSGRFDVSHTGFPFRLILLI